MNFDVAFDRLISHEGGYVNNPKDPGGETNWGVSKRTYPDVDIKNLTRDGAKDIYLRDFWKPITSVQSNAVIFQAFDFAVNSGIQTAIRKLQDAARVADDGHWGPLSAKAANGMDQNDLLMRYIARRLRFMKSLSNWKDFSAGWAERIAANLDFAAEDN